jgi:glutathione S-transferase/maleylpyruvate isomerase
MLTLYNTPVSVYGIKTRILLRHKGLKREEHLPPGGYGSAAYKQVVPSGNVPALIDGNLLIADSEAIAEYIEERYPDPAMMPPGIEERAKARELSRFHDTRLEPEVRVLFRLVSTERHDATLAATQAEAINARLAQLARMVDRRGKERGGNGPSLRSEAVPLLLADCGYPATFAWIDALDGALDLGIVWPGAVSAYRWMLDEQPAVSETMASYGTVIRKWIAEQ